MLTSRANVSVVSSFARVFFFSRGPSLRLPKNLPIELPNGRRCAPQDVRAALCSVKYCCEMAEACLQPISRTCRNCSTAATTTMLDRFPSCDTHTARKACCQGCASYLDGSHVEATSKPAFRLVGIVLCRSTQILLSSMFCHV